MGNYSADNDDYLKVTSGNTLEKISLSMIFLFLLVCFAGGLFFLFGKVQGLVILGIGILGVLLGISFKFFNSENSVFDTNTGFLWLESSYLSWHRRTPIAEIAKIETIFVEGFEHYGRFGNWWTYGIGVLLKSGEKIPISSGSCDDFRLQNDRAKRIAKRIGASFFPARKEKAVVFNPESNPIRLDYTDWPKVKKAEEYIKGFVMAIGLIFLILGTIISLTIFFSQN